MIYHYNIAGFLFRVQTLCSELSVPSLVPFVAEATEEPDFTISQTPDFCEVPHAETIGTYAWFESECTLYRIADKFIWNRMDTVSGEVEQLVWRGFSPTNFQLYSSLRKHVIDHLMLIAVNYAILPHGALILHSSVVENAGRGYMFLGESGTGKSTHTKLWLEHVAGSVMLNDDAPIVRVADGKAVVWGSPWSGKGRVFRNVSMPIEGIYRLSQAPENKLVMLNVANAIAAMLHSCMPPLMEVEQHTDLAFDTLSSVISLTRQFHLACLPDAAAAQMSYRQL